MSRGKIRVAPEGRSDLWLADRDSLKEWILSSGFDTIHNFSSVGSAAIGADHSVDSVLCDIDRAARVAVLTGDAAAGNLGHSLSIIAPAGDGSGERLEMYDIGAVTVGDLEVVALSDVNDHGTGGDGGVSGTVVRGGDCLSTWVALAHAVDPVLVDLGAEFHKPVQGDASHKIIGWAAANALVQVGWLADDGSLCDDLGSEGGDMHQAVYVVVDPNG
jgi:hypothetical protein